MRRYAIFLTAWIASGLGTPVLASPGSNGVESLIRDCVNCHGSQGVSADQAYPTIGGMSTFYLDDQLRTYRAGGRPCEPVKYRLNNAGRKPVSMCEVAKKLSDADIAIVAGYFSKQVFVPAKQPFDPKLAKMGRMLHAERCGRCHSEGGNFADDDAGILAGQWKPYLEEVFREFRAGVRRGPEKMKPQIDGLTDAEARALIEYYLSEQGDNGSGQ